MEKSFEQENFSSSENDTTHEGDGMVQTTAAIVNPPPDILDANQTDMVLRDLPLLDHIGEQKRTFPNSTTYKFVIMHFILFTAPAPSQTAGTLSKKGNKGKKRKADAMVDDISQVAPQSVAVSEAPLDPKCE